MFRSTVKIAEIIRAEVKGIYNLKFPLSKFISPGILGKPIFIKL